MQKAVRCCNKTTFTDAQRRTTNRFECSTLTKTKTLHVPLTNTYETGRLHNGTMRSFFAQQNHLGVLNYVIDCLDFMNI